MVRFLSPEVLWLLLALPLLVGAYVLLMRRRRRFVLRYAELATIRASMRPVQSLRRHIPPALLLLALLFAILATARPEATVPLPIDKRTIIMAVDVSLSMRAADIEPSRLEAAQIAAKGFVHKQPSDIRIGIVTFAGMAALVQPPTRDKEALIAAIDRFTLQRQTAIGSGLLMALAAMFPDEDIDVEKAVLGGISTRERGKGLQADKAKAAPKAPPQVVPPGSFRHGAIILLTDGRRTTGPDPLEVAKIVSQHGVRVFTVGFGKIGGGTAEIDGYSMYMAFDEPLLRTIAEATNGTYYHAASGEELAKVYDELTSRLEVERQHTEITALVSALAGVLLATALGLSVFWFRRLG